MTVPTVQMPASGSPSSNLLRPARSATSSIVVAELTAVLEDLDDLARHRIPARRCADWKISSVPSLVAVDDGLLDVLVDRRLFWAHEPVPMLTPSAPGQRGHQTAGVAETAGGDHRYLDLALAAAGISTGRARRPRRDGWRLEPVDADAVDPEALGFDGMPHRGAHCSTLMPWSWNIGRCGAGLEPAVSTILMPASTMTWRYSSSYGGRLMAGRIVRFTPERLVGHLARTRSISWQGPPGVGWSKR